MNTTLLKKLRASGVNCQYMKGTEQWIVKNDPIERLTTINGTFIALSWWLRMAVFYRMNNIYIQRCQERRHNKRHQHAKL